GVEPCNKAGFRGTGRAVNNAFNTIFEAAFAEVDQQTKVSSAQSQLGEKLFAMDFSKLFDRFQFNDDFVLNQQVDAKALVEGQFIIMDRNGYLPFHPETDFAEFVSQQYFIDAFEEARSGAAVDFKSSIKDNFG